MNSKSKGTCRNSNGIPRESNQNGESHTKGNCKNSIGIPRESNHNEESIGIPMNSKSKGTCRNSMEIPRESNQNEESYEKCNSGIPKETFGIPRKCEATDNRSTKQCWESKGNCTNSIGIPMNSNHTEESYENRSVRKSVKCFWRQRILVVALVSIQIMKK